MAVSHSAIQCLQILFDICWRYKPCRRRFEPWKCAECTRSWNGTTNGTIVYVSLQHSLKLVCGPGLYADISFVTDTGKGWHRRRWRWTGWMGKVPPEQREDGLADPWPRSMVHHGRVFPMCGWLKPKWRHWFCNLWGVALHKSTHVVRVSFILEYVQHINPHKSHMNIPIYINLACTVYPYIQISSFLGRSAGSFRLPFLRSWQAP